MEALVVGGSLGHSGDVFRLTLHEATRVRIAQIIGQPAIEPDLILLDGRFPPSG